MMGAPLVALVLCAASQAVDLDALLKKADQLLDEAKAAYESARGRSAVDGFVEAGFKLEEARIKYLVLQEIGADDKKKAAAERLRAVNQLNKLINDGKAALLKPAAPALPPGSPPPPPPAPAEIKPAANVTARAKIPDVAAQKEAEKLVRELFKEGYAKKAPADRQALARALLEQASKGGDDPAALWVLCREAQDAATQACDVVLALAAVDAACGVFDADGLALRNAALASLSKTARVPADHAALSEAWGRLIDDLTAADQYDAADKASSAALLHARKAADGAQILRATERAKVVAEAKAKFQSMKGVLETLARNPEDAPANGEMGQFLCFVKGNWDLGPRFLVKGPEGPLRALARKEIETKPEPTELAALADGWWELSLKEKSPLRKGRMVEHAKDLYKAALTSATGLVRAKAEKRLAEMEEAAFFAGGSADLLARVDLKRDVVEGEWTLDGKALTAPPNHKRARLQLPAPLPEEYDLLVVAERVEGGGAVNLGLVQGTVAFCLTLDGWDLGVSGLSLLDGKYANENESAHRGGVLKTRRPSSILCAVRKEGLTVTVDGRKIVEWKGAYSRLSPFPEMTVPNARALVLGADSKYAITKIQLTPYRPR